MAQQARGYKSAMVIDFESSFGVAPGTKKGVALPDEQQRPLEGADAHRVGHDHEYTQRHAAGTRTRQRGR